MTILFWISINPFVLFVFQRLKTTTVQKKDIVIIMSWFTLLKHLNPTKGWQPHQGDQEQSLALLESSCFSVIIKKSLLQLRGTRWMDYVLSKLLITFMFKTLQLVQWIPHTHPQMKNSIKPTAINFNAFCKNLKVVYFPPLSYLMVICFQIYLVVLTTINSYLVALELELCW